VTDNFILKNEKISALLEPHRGDFPKDSDFLGYQNHCLRMLNVCLALSEDEPDRLEKLEIALAFHDLTIFPHKTLDYLGSATVLAREYLATTDKAKWGEEIGLMIKNHHKVKKYAGPNANLVEAFRKADWVDVSFGALRFGLERSWVRALHRALPVYTFPRTMVPVICKYMITHLTNPLPNFKI